jgi:hypothetical protein
MMQEPDHAPTAGRSAAIRTVVCGVIAAAVREADSGGVVVMEDWTPEGELVHEWLAGALGAMRVWRVAALASNVHGVDVADQRLLAAFRAARERSALLAHPASKTMLLLGGPPPRADVFPLGDLYASQVARLANDWSVPEAIEPLARRTGGIDVLDAALMRLIEGREPLAAALSGLDPDTGHEVARLYERGRYYRLRPRLVPKLGARTIGVDLFD